MMRECCSKPIKKMRSALQGLKSRRMSVKAYKKQQVLLSWSSLLPGVSNPGTGPKPVKISSPSTPSTDLEDEGM